VVRPALILTQSNMEAATQGSALQPAGSVWLSRHVHLCNLDSTIIALDLERDKYLAFRGPAVQSLAAAVPGWPEPDIDSVRKVSVSSEETSRIIRELVADGVLTPHEANGKKTIPARCGLNAASIALDQNFPRTRHMRWSDVVTFLASCLSIVWSLRFGSLQNAVENVAARRASLSSDVEFDAELAADLVAVFRRLRSFTFGGHKRCLFHALTLIKFLSSYGVCPHFVMGVKLEPWAAHSWVQCGNYILDGTPEQVRFFTPILIV
jgi:Transglutaminase-like superfamily